MTASKSHLAKDMQKAGARIALQTGATVVYNNKHYMVGIIKKA